jgi:hypothetical protein
MELQYSLSGNHWHYPRIERKFHSDPEQSFIVFFPEKFRKNRKKIISDIDYILYENQGADYRVKMKAKKGEFPLILRW